MGMKVSTGEAITRQNICSSAQINNLEKKLIRPTPVQEPSCRLHRAETITTVIHALLQDVVILK